jgi:hypothetical protein
MDEGQPMRYIVKDETGAMLRLFNTRQEALAFCQQGWSVVIKPRAPKPDLHKLLGAAPF